LLFIMLVIGAPLSLRLRDASFSINVPLIVLLDGIAALLFTLMLSTALLQATTAFYGRGDLDLLLSSPLPHARILRIRWAGIIISVASLFGIMVTPILVPFIILDRWQTVGIYCVDLALALAATATGLLVATSWPRCWALLWA
jgi:ABC-2 type transport system permease protein